MCKKVQSTVKPEETDTTSSSKYNYVRSNIKEVTEHDEDGNSITYYEYEETKIPKDQYDIYTQAQKNADTISYIAMMSDINLGGDSNE